MAFVPKEREVQWYVEWCVNAGDHKFPECLTSHEAVLRNDNGVTVLDVVKAVRQELRHAKNVLQLHCSELTSIVGY
jgi:hypothetical protein